MPVRPESHVAEAKNLVNGLPPTDAELQAVKKDPTALRGFVDGWLHLPDADVT